MSKNILRHIKMFGAIATSDIINNPSAILPATFSNEKELELYHAVKAGDQERVEQLINRGSPLNSDHPFGFNPLNFAPNNLIEFLLIQGVDPNNQDILGNTMLHFNVCIEIIQLLLFYGANPNLQNNEGNTPLHDCTSFQKIQILLKYGADPNIRNHEGLTSLHLAMNRIQTAESLQTTNKLRVISGLTPLPTWDNTKTLQIIELLRNYGPQL
jgi:ankyrin repeat protein